MDGFVRLKTPQTYRKMVFSFKCATIRTTGFYDKTTGLTTFREFRSIRPCFCTIDGWISHIPFNYRDNCILIYQINFDTVLNFLRYKNPSQNFPINGNIVSKYSKAIKYSFSVQSVKVSATSVNQPGSMTEVSFFGSVTLSERITSLY